ncbi:MAG: hypothetical protein LAP40_23825 [Acidobacteriia bacterium]|nr:hypothetical protein [Terriglobia bacterium]
MRLQIDCSIGAGYAITDLDGDIATEVVRSDAGLREILGILRAPRDVIEGAINRLDWDRSFQISY